MKKYTDTNIESIYYHDRMGEKKFAAITIFVENYLEKHIKLQDMFNEINSFINYKNNTKDNIFEPETSIMGLSSLLTMAGVKSRYIVRFLKILPIIISTPKVQQENER